MPTSSTRGPAGRASRYRLVLRKTDLSTLPQVADGARRARSVGRNVAAEPMIATGLDGRPVLTAHAAIAPLDWQVFVETPLAEAFAPLYTTLLWNAGLLLLGLAIAVLASLFLARNLVGPIRALQDGAAPHRPGRSDEPHRRPDRRRAAVAGRALQSHGGAAPGVLRQPRRQGRGADTGAGIRPAAAGRRDREHLRGLCPVRPGRPAGAVQQPLSRPALSGHRRCHGAGHAVRDHHPPRRRARSGGGGKGPGRGVGGGAPRQSSQRERSRGAASQRRVAGSGSASAGPRTAARSRSTPTSPTCRWRATRRCRRPRPRASSSPA